MFSKFLLANLLHPESQKKAQDEIEKVVGTDRLPALNDRKDLPTSRRRFSPRDNEVSLISQVLGYPFIGRVSITACIVGILPPLLVCTPCYVPLPDVPD